MYTVSIKASELAKITTENYHKMKDISQKKYLNSLQKHQGRENEKWIIH